MAGKNHIDAIAAMVTEDIYTNNGISDAEEPQVVSEDIDTAKIAKKMKRNISIPDSKTPRRYVPPPYESPRYEFPRWEAPFDRTPPPPIRIPMRMPVVLPTNGSIRIIRGDDGRPTLNVPIPAPAPVVEAIARPAGKMGKRKLDL